MIIIIISVLNKYVSTLHKQTVEILRDQNSPIEVHSQYLRSCLLKTQLCLQVGNKLVEIEYNKGNHHLMLGTLPLLQK